MEKYNVENDIKVICVDAKSFPEGITGAFDELVSKLPKGEKRRLFGISHPDQNGKIIYKAAAEELYDGEAEKLSCEEFIIRKGDFISELVNGLPANLPQIGRVFRQLLAHPDIDPQGYCLEMYLNTTEARCMVGIIEK